MLSTRQMSVRVMFAAVDELPTAGDLSKGGRVVERGDFF